MNNVIKNEELKQLSIMYTALCGGRIFSFTPYKDILYDISMRYLDVKISEVDMFSLIDVEGLRLVLSINDLIYRTGLTKIVLSDIQYDSLEQLGIGLKIKPQIHMEFDCFNRFNPITMSQTSIIEESDDIESVKELEIDGKSNFFVDKGKGLVSTKHKYPMLQGTIKKVKAIRKTSENVSFEDFLSYIKVIPKDKDIEITIAVSKKYDGNSIIASLDKDGNIISALSRGVSGMGKDLTKYMPDFNFNLAKNMIRDSGIGASFECIIKYSDLDKLNEERKGEAPYKNPRSALAGVLGELEGDRYKKYLTLVPLKMSHYGAMRDRIREVQIITEVSNGQSELMDPEIRILKLNRADLLLTIEKIADHTVKNRAELDFMIDGLVIEVLGYTERDGRFIDIRDIVGRDEENSFNNWEIAYKFDAEQRPTKVSDVTFTVGRTGKITPMVHFDTVEFSNGNLYTKASIGSIGKFKALDLSIGDTIIVEYANDVIPYVPCVIKRNLVSKVKVDTPTNCPCCGFKLADTKSGELKCVNLDCNQKVILAIPKALTLLGAKNISSKTIETLFDADIIKSIADMFNLRKYKERITSLEGFGEKKFNNMVHEMDVIQSSQIPDYKLLGTLNISDIGTTIFKKILNNIPVDDLVYKIEKLWLVFEELLEDDSLLHSRHIFREMIRPGMCTDSEINELNNIIYKLSKSDIKDNILSASTNLMKFILKSGVFEQVCRDNKIEFENLIKLLSDIPGIGNLTATTIVSTFTKDKIALFKALKNILNVVSVSPEDDNKIEVCLTGFRDKGDFIKNKLAKVNGVITDSIKSTTAILITVDEKSKNSSKGIKAQKLGISVMTLDEFNKIGDADFELIRTYTGMTEMEFANEQMMLKDNKIILDIVKILRSAIL